MGALSTPTCPFGSNSMPELPIFTSFRSASPPPDRCGCPDRSVARAPVLRKMLGPSGQGPG
eukprot:4060505-Pyramimonas_sp.AAC.1